MASAWLASMRAVGIPGVEDELLELAGGRVQLLEDETAGGDGLEPVGNEAGDEHQRVGDGHHRQVRARRRSRHLTPRHHHQHERVTTWPRDVTSRAPRRRRHA